MKLQIKQSDLKAVAHAMAVNDIRTALNGVAVETDGMNARLIASDGNRMHVVIQPGDAMSSAPSIYILPPDMVKTLCKVKVPKGSSPEFTLELLNDGKATASMPDGSIMTATLIDSQFPDYRRIFPAQLGDAAPANFNYSYITDAYSGLADYMGKRGQPRVTLAQQGLNGAILQYEGFLAIVMPLRCNETVVDLAKFKR